MLAGVMQPQKQGQDVKEMHQAGVDTAGSTNRRLSPLKMNDLFY